MSILGFGSDSEKDIYAPAPIPQRLLKNKKVAIITGDKTEDLEFFYPFYRLTEEGYTVDVITEKGEAFEGKHGIGLKKSKSIENVQPEDYALLYLPGGKAPTELRKNDKVIQFIKQFAASGRPIAAICHGPQLLVTADVIRGKQLASVESVKEEVEQAGATWINEALVEDGQFITARLPSDLHRHLYGVLKYLEQYQGSLTNEPRDTRRSAAAK